MKKYLSIKEMEKLKNLGIDTSNASMVYIKLGSKIECILKQEAQLFNVFNEENIICEAFNLNDILELLAS